MALAITGQQAGILGNLRFRVVDLAFDSAYASGGELLTPATLGFDTIYFVKVSAPAGYVVSYDYTNQTLRAYRIDIAATATVADADNSLIKSGGGAIEVAGTGTAFQAALLEVTTGANMATDLAAVRAVVFGH